MTPLTARELEVLAAYVKCENIAVTADALGLRVSTVKNHLSTAYRKLDTTNVLGAVKALGWLKAA